MAGEMSFVQIRRTANHRGTYNAVIAMEEDARVVKYLI